jgi:hypothetical protein
MRVWRGDRKGLGRQRETILRQISDRERRWPLREPAARLRTMLYGTGMLRLTLAGMDTLVTSPLCARCPSGPAGCCAAPPALAWADLGRIVLHGGTEWLLAELGAGRLAPCPRGLKITRIHGPHGLACTYLGQAGCSLAPDRRSGTCNEYLCEDAYRAAEAEGDPAAGPARAAHAALERAFAAWDEELAAEVAARGAPPELDSAFFEWLGEALRRGPKRLRRSRH